MKIVSRDGITIELKPLTGLTEALCTMLKVTIGITIIAFLARVSQFCSYAFIAPDVDPNEAFFFSDFISFIIHMIIRNIFILVMTVTLLWWIYRISKNLHAFSEQKMKFTPGWSVGWFFIPIAFLYKPWEMMKELWHVSHNDQQISHTFVNRWWGLFLTAPFLDRIAFEFFASADSAAGYALSAALYALSYSVSVILYILTIKLVRRMTEAYLEQFNLLLRNRELKMADPRAFY